MPKVTNSQVEALERFLVGDRPNSAGEWYMHCPYHEDRNRSASLNMETGQWFCHACSIGGSVSQLLSGDLPENDTPFELGEEGEDLRELSYGEAIGYHSALLGSKRELRQLMFRRGLELPILKEYMIGWDAGSSAYTIPVFNAEGKLVNIRRYQLDPTDGRRKIWSVAGHGSPDLYPIDQVENESLVICEGEWDALATIQAGFPAVTRTGAAKVWRSKWNHLFEGKDLFICHDMDSAGRQGNLLVSNELRPGARSLVVVDLPYEVTENHGKDLSDFWEEYDPGDFAELLAASADKLPPPPPEAEKALPISIDQSTTMDLIGKRVSLRVTVDGKSRDDYISPKKVVLQCSMNAGQKCELCAVKELGGNREIIVSKKDPRVLRMMGSNEDAVAKEVAIMAGVAHGCKAFWINLEGVYHVSEYNVRPDIDEWSEERSTHASRNVVVVDSGMGARMLNSTVEMEGAIYPHPRDQKNTLLVDSVKKVETSVDTFKMTDEIYLRLEKFQPVTGQSPLDKMFEIADDLSNNVTRIYQRPEMHVFMDIVFHSVIAWQFNNDLERRGWVDALVLGDSRTGKSEAAEKLHRHYRVGQMTTGENTTFAGLVGGVKQVFGNKWEISWGTIPINDRRLLILDEVSSLQEEEIGRMSSIRSSGEAIIDKIEGGSTMARTRLLWLSNPRDGHQVAYYHHAFEAVNKLIGQREDVARFDMVMSVSNDEVSAEAINVTNTSEDPYYDMASCHDLIGWAWSRTRDQVVWEPGAEEYIVRDLALRMGRRYSEDPVPLVQSANVRVKIARIAVAMAARTFSHHPDDDELVYVTKEHARDAARFLDMIYSNPSFGYLAASKDAHSRSRKARKFEAEMRKRLDNDETLRDYFKTRWATFESRQFIETTGTHPESASALLTELLGWGMLERTQNAWRVSNELRKILREY